MKQIESMNLEELKSLLKEIKKYKDLRTKLGERGKKLFARELENKSHLVVEYFPLVGEKGAKEIAKEVYKKAFGITPTQEEIECIQKEDLKGGIKVYKDDFLVDLSFSKIERSIG